MGWKPHECVPGLERIGDRAAKRFAVSVMLAADKHRAVGFQAEAPSGDRRTAEAMTAFATMKLVLER